VHGRLRKDCKSPNIHPHCRDTTTSDEETSSRQLTPTATQLELVMSHSMLGLFSSEEIDPVQLVGVSLAAVEEGRGVLRLVWVGCGF
jgi:hypothetical protein